eukprot:6577749-Ditylum_brightwellii.AAC.1
MMLQSHIVDVDIVVVAVVAAVVVVSDLDYFAEEDDGDTKDGRGLYVKEEDAWQELTALVLELTKVLVLVLLIQAASMMMLLPMMMM